MLLFAKVCSSFERLKFIGFAVDEDAERRRMLRTKVKQGVLIAENLKKRLRGPIPTTTTSHLDSSLTSSLSPPMTINHHDDCKQSNFLNLLHCLCHSSGFE